VSVALPNGVTLTVPTSTDELAGLRARRDLLSDQLERATDQRESLLRDIQREGQQAVPTEGRAGIQQRITALDARILQIERDQSATDQLISNASPVLLAQSAAIEQAARYNRNMIREEKAAGIGFAAFCAGVVITRIISGWRRRRALRKMVARGATADGAAAITDPRIDRLTQTVEAIAEEVERIGEGQRFVTQLLANRPGSAALQAEAQPHDRI